MKLFCQDNNTLISIVFRDKFIDTRELLVTEMEKKAHELEVEDAEDFGVGKCARYVNTHYILYCELKVTMILSGIRKVYGT